MQQPRPLRIAIQRQRGETSDGALNCCSVRGPDRDSAWCPRPAAAEDFGGRVLDCRVGVLSNHIQNKPDVALGFVRE